MPSATWCSAAAWACLALAAICLWTRARHRLPRRSDVGLGSMAGAALAAAAGLAALGWWSPGREAMPDAVGVFVWRGMSVVAVTLHLAASSCLVGGVIYLAFGRLMGNRACSACGWQAMILERLPDVTAATAVTAVGMAVFIGDDARGLGGGLSALPLLAIVGCLTLVSRSAAMVRQPAIVRTAVVWGECLVVAGLVREACRYSMADDAVDTVTSAGCACGVGLAVLAAALHRKALSLGLRFDQPAALAEIVGGLSPLRRLAACALGGLFLAGVCGLPLAVRHREDLAGLESRLLVVGGAWLWLSVTWGAAIPRDRLGPACSPSIAAGTIIGLIGLASILVRLVGIGTPGESALGLPGFLAVLGLAGLGGFWCAVTVARRGGTGDRAH